MLVVASLLGDADEPRFDGRRRESVPVPEADAAKRRLRLSSETGADVAIDLPRGTYLHDGAVLHDDGERILVVERPLEEALVIRFAPSLGHDALVEAAARIGHAFGNQHVPIEVVDGAVLVPITTSAELASETVRALHLEGLEAEHARVKLGRRRPLSHGSAHEH
jgi:urease accessory protein